ncbi:MAG: hypothetical protein Q4B69_04755 [Slackia sp.]|nr:hypothetical protein [Slackia sp.]
MAVFFGIIVLVGVVSWVIVKNDELSGLGRNVKRSALRHPHGKLVATRCENVPDEVSYKMRLIRVLPLVTFVIMDVVAIAALVMEYNGIVAGIVIDDMLIAGLAVLPIAGECMVRMPKASRCFSSFVLVMFAGLVLATVCGMFSKFLCGNGPEILVTASVIISSIAGCALGCALAAAFMKEPARFNRRFEDGYESEIVIASHGSLFRAYRSLMVGKKAWESGRRQD